VTAEVGEGLILSSAEWPLCRQPGTGRSLRERGESPWRPSRPLARFPTPRRDRSRPSVRAWPRAPARLVKVLLLLARFAACPPAGGCVFGLRGVNSS